MCPQRYLEETVYGLIEPATVSVGVAHIIASRERSISTPADAAVTRGDLHAGTTAIAHGANAASQHTQSGARCSS